MLLYKCDIKKHPSCKPGLTILSRPYQGPFLTEMVVKQDRYLNHTIKYIGTIYINSKQTTFGKAICFIENVLYEYLHPDNDEDEDNEIPEAMLKGPSAESNQLLPESWQGNIRIDILHGNHAQKPDYMFRAVVDESGTVNRSVDIIYEVCTSFIFSLKVYGIQENSTE